MIRLHVRIDANVTFHIVFNYIMYLLAQRSKNKNK